MKILALNWDIVRISVLCDLVKNQHNIFTYLNTDLWMKHNLGPSTDTDVWRWDLLLSLFGEGRGWVCSSWRHMTTLFRCDTAEQKGDLSAPESFVVRMLCWLSSTYDTRIKRAVVTPRRRERIQYGGDLQGLWLSGQKWRSAEKEEPEKDPHISLSNQGFITTEPILIFILFFLESLWNVALAAAMKLQLNLWGLLDYRLWCGVRACLTSCYCSCFFAFQW